MHLLSNSLYFLFYPEGLPSKSLLDLPLTAPPPLPATVVAAGRSRRTIIKFLFISVRIYRTNYSKEIVDKVDLPGGQFIPQPTLGITSIPNLPLIRIS